MYKGEGRERETEGEGKGGKEKVLKKISNEGNRN